MMKSMRAAMGATAISAVLAFAVVGGVMAEEADQTGTNIGEAIEKQDGRSAVEMVQAASVLAEYARANNDAVAMVKAAQLLAAASPSEVERSPESTEATGEGGEAADAVAEGGGAATPASLLDEATDMADGDEIVVAMIDDAKAAATKGAVGGPKYNVAVTPGRTVTNYTVSFYGGQVAEVGLEGDGRADLDLFVYDQNGNMICASNGRGARGYCNWTPRWTGAFRIRVRNDSPAASRYVVVTN